MRNGLPTTTTIARDFARDCARLMNVASHDDLDREESRAVGRRWALRTRIPSLLRSSRTEQAEVLRAYEQGEWVGQRPFAYAWAKVGRLHRLLHEEIIPRLDHPAGFLLGRADIAVRIEEARPTLTDREGAVRSASPFSVAPTTSSIAALRAFNRLLAEALFNEDPVLALHGLFDALPHHWPWSRCVRCTAVYAAGRRGARFCSTTCKGRAAYEARRARLATDSRLQHLHATAASEAVKRIYREKKQGTWKRQRRPGAGRPRKQEGG